MVVVGISALFHNAAVAVVVDGVPVSAAHEERFTRRRHDRSMPINAFRACLHDAGITPAEIDWVAYYEDPVAKLARQLWMGLPDPSTVQSAGVDFSANGIPRTYDESLLQIDASRPHREIRDLVGHDGPIETVAHHESHAASAFYCSGFPDAALLAVDAVGEWTTTSYGRADRDGLELLECVEFPDSIGLFYSAVTSYLGFAVNSDEYKVMALASGGTPRYAEQLRAVLVDRPQGRFRLDPRFFDFGSGGPMYTSALSELLGADPRAPESELTRFHEDVASSAQLVTEEVLLNMVRHLHDLVGGTRLAYAGGVALNCVANSRIRQEGPYDELFIQPAAGDAGGALGAALLVSHRRKGSFPLRQLRDARLGPQYDTSHARAYLESAGVTFSDFSGKEDAMLESVAKLLADGAVVGWFQGRMEFGPRALGARSILADPRREDMRDHINALVKKREGFRPFAPAAPVEQAGGHFNCDHEMPFMLETVQVRDPAALPAVAHVDGSARLQTVDPEVDSRFHRLLTEFGRLTGYPVLLNTSFNERGEPIVCDPEDGLGCFVRCELDALVLGELVVRRDDIPPAWALANLAAPRHAPDANRDMYTFF